MLTDEDTQGWGWGWSANRKGGAENCGNRNMFRWLVLSLEKVTRAPLYEEL